MNEMGSLVPSGRFCSLLICGVCLSMRLVGNGTLYCLFWKEICKPAHFKRKVLHGPKDTDNGINLEQLREDVVPSYR